MTEQGDAGGTRSLGQYGERLAARYLADRGMRVLERNWRCQHGEIDLIALDGNCLVCVRGQDPPQHGVRRAGGGRDLAQGRAAAAPRVRLARRHDVRPDGVRIDVIGILRPATGPAALRHVRGVG